MNNRFQFYEVVVVLQSDRENLQSVIGDEGTVLGMAQDDESKSWSYSVSMVTTGEVWNFDERQLASTGRQHDRLDVYPGDSVKIQVDPKTGRGSIK